tara:strand:- start:24136 stop:25938 length:1803 start_codon:yes stop_codon:yes gene_type:complete
MQVLIPAAGMGKRLGGATSDKTKCMIDLGEKTLIERCLDAVVLHPISRIVMIVGYEKDKLKEFLGNEYKGIEIIYVDNDDYATTNNIFSVFLAKEFLLEDDTILIESDLVFEPNIIKMVIDNKFKNLAVVDKYRPWMDGTVVKIDNNFAISHFIPKKDFNFDIADEYFKTVNIYKFSKEFLHDIYVPFLEAYSKALGDNEYYEQVLKVIVNLDTKELKALPLNGQLWYEIDDIQDLDNAEILFSNPEQKYELISKRYGGYWRFDDFIDFCYLVNPYFPSEMMNNEIKYSLSKLMQSYPSGEKVQAMLASKMFDIPAETIVVGNGAAELISLLTEELDIKLGLFGPTFEEYTARFSNIDLKISEEQGYAYSQKDIINLANSNNNEGVILINPDNPTGNYLPYNDIINILDDFKKSNKILILDESFLDFADDGFNSSTLHTNILNKYPQLIVIKSIGKSYGVGGLRLGVMASSDTKLISKIKSKIPIWNINSVSEFYMQIIGKYKSEYIESCKKLSNARSELYDALKSIDFIHPYKSQANYIFCKVDGIDSKKLAVDLCHRYSVLIKDCSDKTSINDNFIRVAVRDTKDNEYLVSCMKSLLD